MCSSQSLSVGSNRRSTHTSLCTLRDGILCKRQPMKTDASNSIWQELATGGSFVGARATTHRSLLAGPSKLRGNFNSTTQETSNELKLSPANAQPARLCVEALGRHQSNQRKAAVRSNPAKTSIGYAAAAPSLHSSSGAHHDFGPGLSSSLQHL